MPAASDRAGGAIARRARSIPRAVGTRHRVTVPAGDTTAVPTLSSRRPPTGPTTRPVLRSSAVTAPLVATETTASATGPAPIGHSPAASPSTRPASKPVTHRSSTTDGGAGVGDGGPPGRSTSPCRSPATVSRRDRSTISPATSSPPAGSSPSASARSPIVADGSASTTTSRHGSPATASAKGRGRACTPVGVASTGTGSPASVADPPPAHCCSRRIASSVPQPSARLTRSSAEPPSPHPGHRHRGRAPVDSSIGGGAGAPRWAGDGHGCPRRAGPWTTPGDRRRPAPSPSPR